MSICTRHVTFFYNKIGYIADRYHELCEEMRRCGFNVNELPREKLLADMPAHLIRGWVPTEEAIAISRLD